MIGLYVGSTAACFPGEIRDRHASAVEAFLRTPFVDENQPFSEADRALGPPDGRTVALGVGAYISLRFLGRSQTARGPDLRIYEIGADGAQSAVAVSDNGVDFREFEGHASGSSTLYDLELVQLEQVQFVRIRGLDDLGEEPGYDLDAVEALH